MTNTNARTTALAYPKTNNATDSLTVQTMKTKIIAVSRNEMILDMLKIVRKASRMGLLSTFWQANSNQIAKFHLTVRKNRTELIVIETKFQIIMIWKWQFELFVQHFCHFRTNFVQSVKQF